MSLSAPTLNRAILIVLWAVVVVLVLVQARWPADDTFIHLRISRNLVEHHSLAFNPGEPTFSTTSPLWNIVLAAALSATQALPGWAPEDLAMAQGLNLLLALGVLALFVANYESRGRTLALLGAAALALDPYLLYAAAGGMEMSLYALLALTALHLQRRRRPDGTPWSLALLLSLLMQVRPEGAVVVLALVVDCACRPDGRRQASALLGATCLFSLPWLLLWQIHLGSFLPASLLAKSTGTAGHLPLPAPETLRQLGRIALPIYGPFAVMILGAVWWTRRQGGAVPLWPLVRAEALIVGGTILLYALLLKESYISSRYMVTLSPFVVGMTVTALSRLELRRRGPVLARAGLAVVVLLLAAADLYAVPHRNARGRSLEPPRRAAGEWLQRNTPPQAVVYASAIGYVGYYSRRPLVGGEGLVDPEGLGSSVRRGEISVAEYLAAVRPDYAVSTGSPVEGSVLLVKFQAEGEDSLAVWRLPWSRY